MAKATLLSLSLSFLLVFHGCLARQTFQSQQNECQLRRINALEPTERVQAEAGYTEFFDPDEQQFQCAGVEVIRHHVQPQGLLLPSYLNAPLLVYIIQGRGVQGVMLPGCPETYQSSQQQSEGGRRGERGEQQSEGGRRGERGEQSFQDRHQRVQHFRQGDVIAIPAGAAHWMYNDGNEELVAVAMLDTTNFANQLDRNHRRFFLAGNPQQSQQQGQGQGQQRQRRSWGRRQQGGRSQEEEAGNVFSGFDVDLISEAFNVDRETAERLQGQDDQRGHIVRAERGLQVIRPPLSRQEQERQEGGYRGGRGQGYNGLEETICSTKLRENIDDPARADFYNPQAGRCTSLNSFKFPILGMLKLSAERGVLHRNAMVAPHWIVNAHGVLYVTRGNMRVQIVNNEGESVFDDQIQEGQLVVIPQNFAVVKQAGEQGCRWTCFMTNDNAMISTLAGRTSAMRGMPVDVIANAYQISREQAHRLKFSRDETVMFSPGSRSSGRWAEA